MTPKLIESVEISHPPANFFYFVNLCYSFPCTFLVVINDLKLFPDCIWYGQLYSDGEVVIVSRVTINNEGAKHF